MLGFKTFLAALWPVLVGATSLGVGSVAPEFSATDTDGHPLVLEKLLQSGPAVLVFFPKANTSGCTRQLRKLVAEAEALQKRGAHIVAISGDKPKVLQQFRADLQAKFAFVSDADGTLMRLYNVKMPVLNVAKRRTFVVAKNRQVAFVGRDREAIELTGVQAALDALPPL